MNILTTLSLQILTNAMLTKKIVVPNVSLCSITSQQPTPANNNFFLCPLFIDFTALFTLAC